MGGGSAEQIGESPSQLTPGRDASLGVDVAQVKRDGATGDEQLPAHLGVGSTGGDQPRDGELLMGEVEGGAPLLAGRRPAVCSSASQTARKGVARNRSSFS